jgi:signal transduction histidine kinase
MTSPYPRLTSLRQRISIAVVGITSLVVAVAAITTWTSSRAMLLRSVDQELNGWAGHMRKDEGAHLPRHLFVGTTASQQPQRGRGGPFNDKRVVIQIIDANNHELFRSQSLSDGQTLVPDQPGDDTGLRTLALADGRTLRVLTIQLAHVRQELPRPESASHADDKKSDKTGTPDNGAISPTAKDTNGEPPPPPPGDLPPSAVDTSLAVPLTIRFGFDITRLTDELTRSAWMLAAMWCAATILAWGAVMALRATILRPLDRLSAALDRLGPDDLAARLPDDAGPDEVRGIIERLNHLLDRLHQAFAREQATIANIAHELRTPVAALRTDLEFRLLVATDPAERAMLGTCMGTIATMQTQVANLLLLARLEAGKEPLHQEATDLVVVIGEHLERYEAAAARRGQRFDPRLPDESTCVTSADHLRLLLDNLLGNAIAHGLPDQPIVVALTADADRSAISITNAYAGTIDPDSLGKAYYRGDSSRHDSSHCGLGLALCGRLANLLGATLTFSTTDQRFTATVALPVNSQSSSAAD